ncbi:MAG: protein kinase [Chloroflexi bacterium]|nr:protein kinase [Chloroflexota bacterium]
MPQEPPLPKLGQIIAERYRLEKHLGDGNFGEVWKATDLRLESQKVGMQTVFAIKFLKEEYVYDPEVRAEFLGEVTALYTLTHQNLLRLFDCNLLPNMAYLLTEFADNGSLVQQLARKGRLPLQDVGNFLQQAAAGLDSAHAQNFVHRDLKPHNLLLVGQRLVVADFGLAKIMNIGATRSMLQISPAGTPAYMAPEQWEWQVNKSSDIYALGVIVYQMLTGRLPFRAANNSPREWQELHRQAPIPSLRAMNPDLPPQLDEVIEMAMAKDSKSRHTSAIKLSEHYNYVVENLNRPKKLGYAATQALLGTDELQSSQTTRPLELDNTTDSKVVKGWPHIDPDVSVMTRRPNSLVPPNQSEATPPPKTGNSLIKKLGATRQQRVQRNSNSYRFIPFGSLLKTLEGHNNYINSLDFSPDSTKLVSASLDRTIGLWDVVSGRLLKTFLGHTGSVNAVAFSLDGKVLASGSTDKTVRLWNVASGELIKVLDGHSGIIFGLAFSPDGTLLASASADKTIKLWEVGSWRLLHTLVGHTHHVMAVAFSPDTDGLASGSKDGMVRLWELPNGTEIDVLEGHDEEVSSVVFAPDGKRLASGSHDKSVKLWSLETGQDYKTFRNNGGEWVHDVAFSHDGRTLVSVSNQIKLRDMPNGTELAILDGHTDLVNTVVFSADDRYLATGADDKLIKIWSAERLDAM